MWLLIDRDAMEWLPSTRLAYVSVLLAGLSAVLAYAKRVVPSFLSPSSYLLAFFLAVPVLGAANYRQALNQGAIPSGRELPDSPVPTLVWCVGTAAFFLGVFLSRLRRRTTTKIRRWLWVRGRALGLLAISVTLGLAGTAVALRQIGYVPLLRFDVMDDRSAYLETVGAFAARFSGEFWLVPCLLFTTLFEGEGRTRRYAYLVGAVLSALGTLVYAQRSGVFLAAAAASLVHLKHRRVGIKHALGLAGAAAAAVYLLMIQAEYRGGFYSDRAVRERVVGHAFSEWQDYSLAMDEIQSARVSGDWRILVGPFFTLVPRQGFALLGYDKMELVREYSAVYHFGREFGMEYGIRIGPIGEAFAAGGFTGLLAIMGSLGLVFGTLESTYLRLEAGDGRVVGVSYLLALMLYLPLSTLLSLLGPLLHTGVWVLLFQWIGTQWSDGTATEAIQT